MQTRNEDGVEYAHRGHLKWMVSPKIRIQLKFREGIYFWFIITCFRRDFVITMASEKVALVFGASGVTGWAFVNEILNDYPRKGLWNGVLAFTNRPLSVEQSYWPTDDRLSITSGINLLEGTQEELEAKSTKVLGINNVTHVFYVGESTIRL